MLGYRSFRELFMGDAGEASEARLLAADNDLRAAAIKVGHHGSRFASTATFVGVVHPKITVISVGRHNTFGHPSPTTVGAWRDNGARVLHPDRCEAIALDDWASSETMLRCIALAGDR